MILTHRCLKFQWGKLLLPGGGPGDFDSDIGLSDVEPDNGHWCWAPLWDIDDEIYFEPALKRSKFV